MWVFSFTTTWSVNKILAYLFCADSCKAEPVLEEHVGLHNGVQSTTSEHVSIPEDFPVVSMSPRCNFVGNNGLNFVFVKNRALDLPVPASKAATSTSHCIGHHKWPKL
jgi:hypothetical protein